MATLAIYDERSTRLICEFLRERDMKFSVGEEIWLVHAGEPDVWKVVRVRHCIRFAPGPVYSIVTQVFAEPIG